MKLLICDDDINMIDLIQNQLNLQEIGVERLLRAYNGNAAKELIRLERPEMILCDIGMPQSSGIEVLKFVHDNKIDAEFTFLTCYESFEYARDAVRYGAANYLTKPVDLNELRSTLCAMATVSRAKAARDTVQYDDQKRTAAVLNNLLRNMRDGIFGSDQKRIQKELDRQHLDLRADSRWYVVSVGADMSGALKDGWKPDIMRYSFQFLMEEGIANRLNFMYLLADAGERYDTLTLLVEADQVTPQMLEQRCRRTANICTGHMGITPYFVISDPICFYEFTGIANPIRKQIHKYRMCPGSVNYFSCNISTEALPAPVLNEEEILKFIRQQDKKSLMDAVSRAVEDASQTRETYDKQMYQLHHDLLQIFYGCLHDNHIPAHELFATEAMRELDAAAEQSMFDMMNFVANFFDKSIEALRSKNSYSNVIGRAKAYMEEHFRENIDRDEISSVAFITPNYLSKRFRAETGMSIREYINMLRIRESKRLLLTTDLPVSQIACEIGFDNISYFSTVFRKITGVSPVEWKTAQSPEAEQ